MSGPYPGSEASKWAALYGPGVGYPSARSFPRADKDMHSASGEAPGVGDFAARVRAQGSSQSEASVFTSGTVTPPGDWRGASPYDPSWAARGGGGQVGSLEHDVARGFAHKVNGDVQLRALGGPVHGSNAYAPKREHGSYSISERGLDSTQGPDIGRYGSTAPPLLVSTTYGLPVPYFSPLESPHARNPAHGPDGSHLGMSNTHQLASTNLSDSAYAQHIHEHPYTMSRHIYRHDTWTGGALEDGPYFTGPHGPNTRQELMARQSGLQLRRENYTVISGQDAMNEGTHNEHTLSPHPYVREGPAPKSEPEELVLPSKPADKDGAVGSASSGMQDVKSPSDFQRNGSSGHSPPSITDLNTAPNRPRGNGSISSTASLQSFSSGSSRGSRNRHSGGNSPIRASDSLHTFSSESAAKTPTAKRSPEMTSPGNSPSAKFSPRSFTELSSAPDSGEGRSEIQVKSGDLEFEASLAPKSKPKAARSHNAVERRYRNNMNQKIFRLRQRIPDLAETYDGALTKVNKGAVLTRAAEMIDHLQLKNRTLIKELNELRAQVRKP